MIMSPIVWRAHTRISDAIAEAIRSVADEDVIATVRDLANGLHNFGAPTIEQADRIRERFRLASESHLAWADKYERTAAPYAAKFHLADAVLCEQVANAYDDLARAMRTQAHGGPSGVGSDANHIGR